MLLEGKRRRWAEEEGRGSTKEGEARNKREQARSQPGPAGWRSDGAGMVRGWRSDGGVMVTFLLEQLSLNVISKLSEVCLSSISFESFSKILVSLFI